MQTLFLSHGSPMLALEQGPTTQFLRGLAAHFPRPKAILAVSAHWETAHPMLTGAATPQTIHDFYGFPPALYALNYPAAGAPELAARVQALLQRQGFPQTGIDPTRGLDHGAWNPLLLMYPEADIPVIQLSVQPAQDAAWHYRLGQALATLRSEGILILASGNLTHNLREAFRGHTSTPLWVTAFARWVSEALAAGDVSALLDWHRAPHALKNHPTPEHFLPLFVALGASGEPLTVARLHDAVTLGVLAMDAYAFGRPTL